MAPAATPCPGLEVVPPDLLSRHLGRLLVGLVPFFLRHRRDNQIQIFVPALRVPSLVRVNSLHFKVKIWPCGERYSHWHQLKGPLSLDRGNEARAWQYLAAPSRNSGVTTM